MPQTRSRTLFVGLLLAGMLWLNFLFFLGYRHGMKRGYTDFSVYYTAGIILREGLGHQLYDREVQLQVQEDFAGHLPFRRGPLPFIHPPFEALICLPFSFLSYSNAFLAWDVASVLMLVGVAFILRRSVDVLRPFPEWQFVLAALAFFPVFMCLLQGQDSILLLLTFALAHRAIKRNSDLLAGCWLALASFKFQFTIPVLLLFLIWGRRRLALGFAPVAFVLLLLSAGIAGTKSLIEYPGFALRVVDQQGLGGVPLSLLPNLHGLAMGWPNPFSGPIGTALGVFSSIAVFGFAASKGRATETKDLLELQFSLAIVVSVVIAWQTNIHDLSLLVLPLVLLTDYCVQRHEFSSRSALLLPAFPLLIGPVWMMLWLWIAQVNLAVIPLLWWVWEIARELSGKPAAELVSA